MDGIIPLFKPKGPTSHDCVFKLRKMLGIKKIGHTGTLDPEVEGVLPLCVGEGTKVIPFLSGHIKEYVADFELGQSTTTEDATGEVVEKKPVPFMPSETEINRIFELYLGEIKQIPPMYSAVKINGKKLYEYARKGIEVERPERKVIIQDLECLEVDVENKRFRIRVICSKGTYVRTLCVDIGKTFGYPAHMTSLIRTATDGISIEETVDFKTLEESVTSGNVKKQLLPVERVLEHLDEVETDDTLAKRVSYGQKLPLPDKERRTEPFKMMHNGRLLAIYETRESDIKPVRIFNLNKSDGES